MNLHSLKPAHGSRRPATRVGRGEGSGHGKTSGRGGKGQTARTGGSIHPSFEGGQTPLYRRLPKVGFKSRVRSQGKNVFLEVCLADLERFDDGAEVTIDQLKAKKLIQRSGLFKQVKLLGSGELTKKNLVIKLNAITASAKAKVEALGGKVELV